MVKQAERSEATIAAILGAARKLFTARGFEATSIDEIGAKAGVAKGAVYHHFKSKEAIFERVLDAVQAEIAAIPPPAGPRPVADPVEGIANGVLAYLHAASQRGRKRILLIDGPAVIGWLKWREIDAKYFGAGAHAAVQILLGEKASGREVETVTQLLLGMVMEAALVCATAADPKKTAREVTASLRKMLAGLR
jgi:AcrR family transcriptional regulator